MSATLDLSAYDFTKTPADWPHDWCIDDRHLRIVHDLALQATGNVVEVGCFRGRSTAAFVEALNAGADFHLHLVDIKVTPELRRVVEMCWHPDRITIHETPSRDFRLDSASLWLVDGDHTWPAVLDVLNALSSGAQCILMHDTRAHEVGFKECEGAALAAAALRARRDRYWREDWTTRLGELTQRGFLASCSVEWLRPVASAFSTHCG